MLTLSLLRHAKSNWGHPDLEDIDRPLDARGEKAAPRMGAFLLASGLVPDLILCSPALRTRQTLALAFTALPAPPEIIIDETLYEASTAALMATLRAVPAGKHHVMVIGHNPGLQLLALSLAGSGSTEAAHAIADKFPTCAVAVLTFNARSWRNIRPRSGHLVHFVTPRLLRGTA